MADLSPGCLVECLGLPGAGKSRLCAELHGALGDAGRPAHLHLRRPAGPTARLAAAGAVAVFALRRPGAARRALAAIGAARPAERAWLARTWLKRSATAARLRRTPGIHLIDVGLAQALWSLASRAPAGPGLTAALDALIAEAPPPDLVVRLEVAPERLRERLAGRPRPASRLERRPGLDAARLEHGRRLVELVANRLEARRPRPTPTIALRNDGESDLLRNVERIAAILAADQPAATGNA